VVGQTGTEMFKALHEDGRMLVYGSRPRTSRLSCGMTFS
jgi:hypothetical protein